MKKGKNNAKKTLCLVLSMAMIFTNTGMSVFAEGDTQAEETQQVVEAEESSYREETETFFAEEVTVQEETESAMEETERAENELSGADSFETDVDVENIREDSTESILAEDGLTEGQSVDGSSGEQAETGESEPKLSFSNTDIAHGEYKKNGNDITWVIDANGKLIVEGTGDFADPSNGYNDRAPWHRYSTNGEIKTAEIRVKGMTNSSHMFEDCAKLTKLDLSGFDTSLVGSMSGMFSGCSSLTRLDLSEFNTSRVRGISSMSGMFENCSSLTELDLSGFDTSQVPEMRYMFSGCSSLTELDLSSFDTSQMFRLEGMFSGCSNLMELDLSGFSMEHVNDGYGYADEMFLDCINLKSINIPYKIKITCNLPSIFYDVAGNTYEELPQGLSHGILLTKDQPNTKTAYITVTKTKTVYESGDTINTDDLTVRYYGTDGTVKQLEYSEYTTNAETIDTSKAGKQNLTVTYNGLTADVPLKILKKEGSGTEESSTVEESSTTEESNITEESSATEESGKTEESGGTEESSTVEESSATGESGKTEESSATEESSTVEESSDMDDSPYPDDERTDLSSIAAVAAIKDKIYDGEAYEPVLKVTAAVGGKKTTLTEGADYRVLYEQGQKSADVGEHTVMLRGNGEYKGQVVKTFTIKPKSIKKIKIITVGIVGTTDLDTLPLCVYDGVKRLQLGTDYTLSDYRTTKPTAVEALVKGVGNYEGTVKAKFTIYESGTQFIAPACVTLTDDAAAYAYTGKAVKSQVTVIVNGTTLTNKDYKVQYQNNKNAGTAYVIVTGKGVYKGNVVLPFTIRTETVEKPNDFSIEEIKAKTYNGKLQKPAVSVTI